MLDVLASGYPSLDHIIPVSHSPGEGESATISAPPSAAKATDGGCGANVAVGLTRLGLRAGVATIVGDDEAGTLYRSRLAAQGIDTSDVIVVPGAQSSQCLLFRNPDGEYQIFFFAGAADEWSGNLTLQNLDNMRYGLLTVAPADYNRQFVNLAQQRQIPLIWQLKSAITSFPPETIAFFAQASRVIIMNHIEAEYVQAGLGLGEIGQLINGGTQVVLITRGRHGSRLITAAGIREIGAVPIQATDTTGAGDAFTAGFLAGMLQDYELATCAQIGAVVASFALEVVGCQSNLPDWAAMVQRHQQYFGEL